MVTINYEQEGGIGKLNTVLFVSQKIISTSHDKTILFAQRKLNF